MAADNFEKCLPVTLAFEGGDVDDPRDPGGATSRGVTQAVYDAYRDGKHMSRRTVFQMESHEMVDIYRARYWGQVGGERLPLGVDLAVFDFSVNSGVRRAVSELQHLVGVKEDGVMGAGTLTAVLEYAQTKSPLYLLEAVCDDRMAFLKGRKNYSIYGNGWRRRVMGDHDGLQDGDNGIIDIAGAMALGDPIWGPNSKVYTPKTWKA